jgi:hypothetical protein
LQDGNRTGRRSARGDRERGAQAGEEYAEPAHGLTLHPHTTAVNRATAANPEFQDSWVRSAIMASTASAA